MLISEEYWKSITTCGYGFSLRPRSVGFRGILKLSDFVFAIIQMPNPLMWWFQRNIETSTPTSTYCFHFYHPPLISEEYWNSTSLSYFNSSFSVFAMISEEYWNSPDNYPICGFICGFRWFQRNIESIGNSLGLTTSLSSSWFQRNIERTLFTTSLPADLLLVDFRGILKPCWCALAETTKPRPWWFQGNHWKRWCRDHDQH